MDADQLAPLCAKPERWARPLSEAMTLFGIDLTNERIAMFLAQCASESARFTKLEEDLRYSAAGILRTWPSRFTPEEARSFAFKPEAIANRAYALRDGNGRASTGDGWRYRGRGPLQVTLRNSYKACGEALGLPLLEEPDLLLEPENGAPASAWFWQQAGCNEVADEGDFDGVSGIINRGDRNKVAINLDDRKRWLRVAIRSLDVG